MRDIWLVCAWLITWGTVLVLAISADLLRPALSTGMILGWLFVGIFWLSMILYQRDNRGN